MNRKMTNHASGTDARAVINYALNVASMGYGSTSSIADAIGEFADAMAAEFESDLTGKN